MLRRDSATYNRLRSEAKPTHHRPLLVHMETRIWQGQHRYGYSFIIPEGQQRSAKRQMASSTLSIIQSQPSTLAKVQIKRSTCQTKVQDDDRPSMIMGIRAKAAEKVRFERNSLFLAHPACPSISTTPPFLILILILPRFACARCWVQPARRSSQQFLHLRRHPAAPSPAPFSDSKAINWAFLSVSKPLPVPDSCSYDPPS